MKKFKRLVLFQFVILLLCVPVHSLAIDLQLQSGASFDWFKGSHSVSASQLTFPLQFTGAYDNLSFRLTTGLTRTSLSTGSETISMTGLLDTKVGATYRMSDNLPIELLFGLDFNLPTGKTGLTPGQTLLVMDPDLLPINTYGEGFNINPTVTVAKGWQNWTFALGVGYLWRGSYDFSDTIKDYQPGMAVNSVVEARYYYQPKSSARFFTGYTIYGTDTEHGHDYFKEGNVLQIGGSILHVFGPELKVSGGLSCVLRGDATVYNQASGNKQDFNAFNGTETILDFGGSYALNSKTVLSVPLQVRLMADNGNSAPYHSGARQKISLGVGATHEIIPKLLSANVTLKSFYKHDAESELLEKSDAMTYNGIGIAASVTGRF